MTITITLQLSYIPYILDSGDSLHLVIRQLITSPDYVFFVDLLPPEDDDLTPTLS